MTPATLTRAKQILSRGVRTHYVYFIAVETERGAAVKIGTSHDPDGRIVGIRRRGVKVPDHVVPHLGQAHLVGQVEGDNELETELHRAFAHANLIGEWFDYDQISDDIDELLAVHCVCRGCQAVKV